MNLERLINMVIRQVMRRVINKGINKSMSAGEQLMSKRARKPQNRPDDQR